MRKEPASSPSENHGIITAKASSAPFLIIDVFLLHGRPRVNGFQKECLSLTEDVVRVTDTPSSAGQNSRRRASRGSQRRSGPFPGVVVVAGCFP